MKKLITVALVAIVSLGFALGCEKATPTKEGATPQAMESISAPTVTIGNKAWTVEIAKTINELKKGLSDRDSLSPNNGMWFVFDSDVRDPFWMKGTRFNLDIAFVDANMKIVYLARDNQAMSEEFIQPPTDYRYVLEVGARQLDQFNVGDSVQLSVGP